MKKTFLIAALLTSFCTFAQLKNMLMNKAGSMLNNNKKTENNSTDTTTKNNQPAAQSKGGFLGSMGGKADAQAEYNFNANVLVEIQNYKKSGEKDGDPANIRYHFNDASEYFATEMNNADKKGKSTETFSVAEFKKNQMVTFINNNGEKTGMIMKYDLQKAVNNAKDTSGFEIKKTGKTKNILGYNCDEYIGKDKKGNVTEYWVTKELKYDISKMFASSKNNQAHAYEGGFTMEMTMNDKDGKKTTWIVKEVNAKAEKKVLTADYNFPF